MAADLRQLTHPPDDATTAAPADDLEDVEASDDPRQAAAGADAAQSAADLRDFASEDVDGPDYPTVDSAGRRMGGLVPAPEHLPNVLPTDRLTASGKARPPLRDELRRIHNGRNAVNVVGVWLQSVGVIAVACWIDRWWVWPIAFLLVGRCFALFSILGHEGAHRLLFSKKKVNDLVGKVLVAYPAFVPFDAYRRSHFAHHKDEFGPAEPDHNLYNGYPIPAASWRRKLWRDARGSSGWKNLKGLAYAWRSESARPVAAKITAAQVVVWAGLWLAFGRWWLYPVLWLLPWVTVWRVINRLRAVAEHGGMTRSSDRRLTTHVVRQTWPARFWIVPYNTGYHLAHHVDMGVPFQQLPRLHRELVDAGWVTPEIEYRSYTALWRAASAG